MGTKKTPQALDRFLPIDFQTLQAAIDRGQITMKFDTDNQAMNTKYRLWRLKESLQAYAKGDPLQVGSMYLIFKIRDDVLTISDRRQSREYAVQAAVVAGKPVDAVSADPMEIVRPSDEELEAYVQARLKEEQQNVKD